MMWGQSSRRHNRRWYYTINACVWIVGVHAFLISFAFLNKYAIRSWQHTYGRCVFVVKLQMEKCKEDRTNPVSCTIPPRITRLCRSITTEQNINETMENFANAHIYPWSEVKPTLMYREINNAKDKMIKLTVTKIVKRRLPDNSKCPLSACLSIPLYEDVVTSHSIDHKAPPEWVKDKNQDFSDDELQGGNVPPKVKVKSNVFNFTMLKN